MKPRATGKNSIRIIGGELRSRRIEFIDHPGLRPTGDRVRETLFNWLQHPVVGAACLDLFAGSGALGLEAMSRGARCVDLVDADRRVVESIRANTDRLQVDGVRVIHAQAESWLQQKAGEGEGYDIVFLDPPFGQGCLQNICAQLDAEGLLNEGALVYIESDKPVSEEWIPEGWELHKSKRAGQVYFYLYALT